MTRADFPLYFIIEGIAMKDGLSREIEGMFKDYSDSNHISWEEYNELTTHHIDREFYILVELLGKKLDRERKKKKHESYAGRTI